MSKRGHYLGGSTVIGPRSGWFSKPEKGIQKKQSPHLRQKKKGASGALATNGNPGSKEATLKSKKATRKGGTKASPKGGWKLIKRKDKLASDAKLRERLRKRWRAKNASGGTGKATTTKAAPKKSKKKTSSLRVCNPERAKAVRDALTERMSKIVVIRKLRRKISVGDAYEPTRSRRLSKT